MTDTITQESYTKEIKSLAYDLAHELLSEHDNDREEAEEAAYSRISETCDGHQWVIYYAYNDDVAKYSDNSEAYEDVYDNEALGQVVRNKNVNAIGTIIAYFAMTQDIHEEMDAAFDWACLPNEGE